MQNSFLQIFTPKKLVLASLVMMYFLIPHKILAATLYLSPSSSTIAAENIVTIKVILNTSGAAINNAEAAIQFPTDLLEVVSISKSSSIFSLWVEEPSFSNSLGRITFNGGVANPGFNGSSGTLAAVTFKAKKPGAASVLFTDAAVRQNDGLGTDVLTAKSGSVVQIGVANKVIVPVVSSETKVDKVPPEPFVPTSRIYDNLIIIKLDAKDFDSGMDYYGIQIDASPTLTVKARELINNEYTLPYVSPGIHSLTVVAYDKAGNSRVAELSVVGPFISSPHVSVSSYEIIKGDTVVISGDTDYPGRQVVVTLVADGEKMKEYTQTISPDGTFSITTDPIDSVGLVNISAENILSESVKSAPSPKLYLKVGETRVVKMAYVLTGLIVILILFLILLALLYVGWHKFFGLRKKLQDRLQDTVTEVHKASVLLKEEMDGQLDALEKLKTSRDLNKKEQVIFNHIKKNVTDVDDFIEKKLKKLI